MKYKNHYVLIKILRLFLGNHHCNFVCSTRLYSYSIQNVTIKHRQRCDQPEIISIRIPNESHIEWKNHFEKSPINFRIYAGFEANNENDNSTIVKKRLVFIHKTQYVMLIIYCLKWIMYEKVVIMKLLLDKIM